MTKPTLNIVKVGGAVVEDPQSLDALLSRFAAINGPKALVHGGGRAATRIASQLGIETRMVEGRRVTDEPMLDVVTMVYGGLVNKNIVAKLQAAGVNALGLTGADLGYMTSDKRPVKTVDYGWVGDVREVNADILADLVGRGVVPVLAPLTCDGRGHLLNTNADTIASQAAQAFAKHFDVTLTFCFEMPGVMDGDKVISRIDRETFQALKASGVVSGGMIPKLDNSFDAIAGGVSRVVITNTETLGTEDSGTVIE